MQNRESRTIAVRLMVPSLGLLATQISVILIIFFYLEGRHVSLLPLPLTIPLAITVFLRYRREREGGTWFLLAAALLSGTAFLSLKPDQPPAPSRNLLENYRTADITGRRKNRGGTLLEADLIDKTDGETRSLRGALYLKGDMELFPGSRIVMTKPCRPLKKSTPSMRSLVRRGFHCRAWIKEKDIVVIKKAAPSFRRNLRGRIGMILDNNFTARNAGILRGLYFGNRHSIDPVTLFHFRRNGVLHLLAASGLHVAMVATLPLFLFSLFPGGSPLKYLPALGTVAFYIWLTDLPPSLLRAGTMFGLFVLMRIIRSDREIFNVLFLAAIILLGFFPEEVFSAGFHLSFGATLGILLFYERCRGAFVLLPPILRNPLAVSLAAQSIAGPVICLVMGEATPGGLLCNLLMVPLVTLSLYGSLITLLLTPLVPPAAPAAAFITDKLMNIMRLSAEVLQHVSGHGTVEAYPLLLLVPLMPLLLLALPLRFKNLRGSLGAIILMAPLVFVFTAENNPAGRIIQTGECRILAQQFKGKTVLCGFLPQREGIYPLKNLLVNMPVSSLHLVIPEPDWQNLQNWQSFIETSPVTRCTVGRNFDLSATTEEFFTSLKRKNIPVTFLNFPPGSGKKRNKFEKSPSNSIDSALKIKYIYNTLLVFQQKNKNALFGER